MCPFFLQTRARTHAQAHTNTHPYKNVHRQNSSYFCLAVLVCVSSTVDLRELPKELRHSLQSSEFDCFSL